MNATQFFYNIDRRETSSNCNFQDNIVVSPPLTPIVHNAITTPVMSFRQNNFQVTGHQENNYYFQNYSFVGNLRNCDTSSPILEDSGDYFVGSPKEQKKHKHVCHYNFCGWSFKRYEHLKRHMLVHTGERPHQCHFPGCGKRFSRSDNFHAHYRTHTKTKNCATTNTKKKSAAVTTVSAAVTSGVTNTQNDSSGQYPLLANQQDRNFISSNKSTASSIATTAAVVAVSQQQKQQNQQVFYNSRLCGSDISNIELSDIDAFYNYEEANNFTMTSPPTPTFNHFNNNANIINAPLTLPSQSNLSSNSSSIISSPNNYPEQISYTSSSIDSFFSSTVFDHAIPIYAPNNLSNKSNGTSSCYSSFQQHPVESEIPMGNYSNAITPVQDTTKTHTCPIPQCSRRFKRLEHLKRHMRIHTLERPFQCSYYGCFKRFSRSDNLTQHIKTHQKHLKQ